MTPISAKEVAAVLRRICRFKAAANRVHWARASFRVSGLAWWPEYFDPNQCRSTSFRTAVRYFSWVRRITSAGRWGAGGCWFQRMVSK